jgi:hypothetical protein
LDRRETTVAKNEQAVVLTNVGENELYNQMETCREKPAAALDKLRVSDRWCLGVWQVVGEAAAGFGWG